MRKRIFVRPGQTLTDRQPALSYSKLPARHSPRSGPYI